MGLFDGKIIQLGVKLSERLREKATAYHEEAANFLTSGKHALSMRASLKGEILEDMAEVIEGVTSGE